ncbi:LysR family transcriptional regulator [Romboutsia sp.]|uniref:LysR family transcriptional regulator n=1 Tax=Romboutsia sp. TaxID=1965302 RepID=UPI002D0B3798|nr:LysR family transcriptional regulator [Romboutsia sp.]HSQ89839.1 LysR family transcriptional regulator [Romboutsia sp.]
MLGIRELTYFVEVVKEKNFTKASNNLHISQPALSKAIKSIEDDINVKLIERANRKFKLTYEGEVFYENAINALTNINREISKLYESINGIKKSITVGIPPVIGTVYFTSIISDFKNIYPNIEFNMIEEGANFIKQQVSCEDIDIGVVVLPIKSDDLISIPISNGQVVLVVNKDNHLSKANKIKLEELKDEKFISFDTQFMMRNKVVDGCRLVGFEPQIICESSQWDFVVEMVSLNKGISILPRPIVEKFKTKDIVLIEIYDSIIDWNIGFIVKRDKYLSDEVKSFIEFTNSSIKNKYK